MGRRAEAIAIVAIMPLGLFMNAALGGAFGARPWAFVVPFLICRLGLGLAMLRSADNALMREHFSVQLAWITFTSVLWCVGAEVGAEDRLAWWAAAAEQLPARGCRKVGALHTAGVPGVWIPVHLADDQRGLRTSCADRSCSESHLPGCRDPDWPVTFQGDQALLQSRVHARRSA